MEGQKKFQQRQRKSQRNSPLGIGENIFHPSPVSEHGVNSSRDPAGPKDEGSHLKGLKKYALWLFGKKSYTEHELFEKLKMRCLKKGPREGYESVCRDVIEYCRRFGLINDEKILENFLEFQLQHRPMGRFAFLQRMHRRGIPFERANDQWQRRNIDEHSLARSVAAKRLVQLQGAPTVVQRQKIMLFLAGRGFSPQTVYTVIDKIFGTC